MLSNLFSTYGIYTRQHLYLDRINYVLWYINATLIDFISQTDYDTSEKFDQHKIVGGRWFRLKISWIKLKKKGKSGINNVRKDGTWTTDGKKVQRIYVKMIQD